jgi:hypothetical protein
MAVVPVRFLDRSNDFDVERAITAMMLSPTLEDAVDVLKLHGIVTTVHHLRVWRDVDPAIRERYGKRRQELAPQIEGRLANDLLDNAERASAVIGVAIERTQELLDAGKVAEPSRVARDLSQVVAQSIDKRLAIQGRPTQITEHSDVGDIIRKLQAIGVIEIIDSTAEDIAS